MEELCKIIKCLLNICVCVWVCVLRIFIKSLKIIIINNIFPTVDVVWNFEWRFFNGNKKIPFKFAVMSQYNVLKNAPEVGVGRARNVVKKYKNKFFNIKRNHLITMIIITLN